MRNSPQRVRSASTRLSPAPCKTHRGRGGTLIATRSAVHRVLLSVDIVDISREAQPAGVRAESHKHAPAGVGMMLKGEVMVRAAHIAIVLSMVFAAPLMAQDAKAGGEKVYTEQKCSLCHSLAG